MGGGLAVVLGLGAGCKKWEKQEGEGGADTYTRRGVRGGLGGLAAKGKGWWHRRVNGWDAGVALAFVRFCYFTPFAQS
jgi:hypothetical protein